MGALLCEMGSLHALIHLRTRACHCLAATLPSRARKVQLSIVAGRNGDPATPG